MCLFFLVFLSFYTKGNQLTVGGHDNACLVADCVLASPQAGDGLLLGIELETRLAVERVCSAASDTLLVSSEAEHWEWDRDGAIVGILGWILNVIGNFVERENTYTLIPSWPASIWRWNLVAVGPERVKTAAPLPYSLALISSIASSRVSTSRQTRTGPKISSL